MEFIEEARKINMNNKQNLHTHSKYCDGADTLEEIVLTAIEREFESIGFSGHSFMHFNGRGMSPENTEKYKSEINELKKKYADRIKIYCGLEFEMCSKVDLSGYDYLIGSVHYFPNGDSPIAFDRSAQVVKEVIDTYFGGDGMKYAKEYYRLLATLPQYGNFDILGHFDLITKHSDNADFFDEDCEEYRKAAIEAVDALAGKIHLFEVNTGAIARGNRKTPYPAPFIIKEMKRLGYGAVISSDCHDRQFLDCAFEDAAELLKYCGYKERYILTDKGFEAVAL